MRVSLVQNNIIWEHKSANILYYDSLLSGLAGKTDLVVLPEMCTTGFSLNAADLAESDDGETINAFTNMAKDYGFAIAGSIIGTGNNKPSEKKYYNRGFFIKPDGEKSFYNKRHTFRMGEENMYYAEGNEKLIVDYMGWNISMIICYDLRFPVWTRNIDNQYDLLLVVANWPESRQEVWKSLLTARAIENMSYVCGVNRVGTDGMGIKYTGESRLINAYGTNMTSIEYDTESIETIEIDLQPLNRLREKFPVWKDADRFEIKL